MHKFSQPLRKESATDVLTDTAEIVGIPAAPGQGRGDSCPTSSKGNRTQSRAHRSANAAAQWAAKREEMLKAICANNSSDEFRAKLSAGALRRWDKRKGENKPHRDPLEALIFGARRTTP